MDRQQTRFDEFPQSPIPEAGASHDALAHDFVFFEKTVTPVNPAEESMAINIDPSFHGNQLSACRVQSRPSMKSVCQERVSHCRPL